MRVQSSTHLLQQPARDTGGNANPRITLVFKYDDRVNGDSSGVLYLDDTQKVRSLVNIYKLRDLCDEAIQVIEANKKRRQDQRDKIRRMLEDGGLSEEDLEDLKEFLNGPDMRLK